MTRTQTRAGREGFTLVELMVALTGGLFVSLAVFALARDSGRFYSRESRLANATVGALIGFERLRTDIARAGFLASPNIATDPRVCLKPDASWPHALRSLAGIQITQPASTSNTALIANSRNPPSLLLAGSYTSSDLYPAKVVNNGNTVVFQLRANSPAMARLGNGAQATKANLQTVFATGRGLRFVQYGMQYYGQIVDAAGGAAPTVTTDNTAPPIQFRTGSQFGCGANIIGSGVGEGTINVVNFINYSILNLNNAQTPTGKTAYSTLYTNSSSGPGETNRTELVRVEESVTGSAIDGTEELVAEYAVDLAFQVTAVTNVVGCCDPVVNVITPTNALFATYTGDTFGSAATPQRVRSVRVRLGVRSREGDRTQNIGGGTANTGLYRFNVGEGAEPFARVRTFQADVALYNQMDVLW